MSVTGERLRANTWGPYYVTDECNGCGLCAFCVPEVFFRSWDGTYYAVLQQPSGEVEEAAVQDAMAACPMHCIRDDGDARD